MRNLLFIIVLLNTTGCVIHERVSPVRDDINKILCVEKNDKVLMEGFHSELISQLETMGIKTQTHTFESKIPEGCIYSMDYTANWQWDMAMYLVYADIKVYRGDRVIGKIEYDAKMGGGRLDKFGTTANIIRPLLQRLFKKIKNVKQKYPEENKI